MAKVEELTGMMSLPQSFLSIAARDAIGDYLIYCFQRFDDLICIEKICSFHGHMFEITLCKIEILSENLSDAIRD
jgi:hypothetical protein